jgi:subtilisin family serine protease
MSDERVTEKKHSDVIAPNGYATKNSHGDDVMSHIKLVAPEGEFISYPFAGTFSGDTYKSNAAEYIKGNKIHIFTTSETGSYPSDGKQKAIQDCIEAGCLFFGCAGNENTSGIRAEIKYEGFWAIGGVKPVYENGEYNWSKINKTRTSSVGEELDFVGLAEIIGPSGTSFVSPIVAGMVGLVQQFFIKNAGRRLTKPEMFLFIKDNCLDVEAEGFDIRTGYGLFILPEPSTINIKRYVAEYKEISLAELQINNKIYLINGQPKEYDVAPFIKDNRTYVPVRFLEDIGLHVEWIKEEQKVIIKK